MKKTPIIIATLLLALGPVAVELWPVLFPGSPIGPSWRLILTNTGPVLLAFKVLYDNIDTVYFQTTKLWLNISRRPVQWAITSEFEGDISKEDKDAVVEILRAFGGEKSRIWSDEPFHTVIRLPGLAAHTKLLKQMDTVGSDHSDTLLLVEFSDLEVAFPRASSRLEEIIELLSEVAQELGASAGKFSIRVAFNGGNPYFGLYVRRLHLPSHLTAFELDATEQFGQKNVTIQVTKDDVRLTSSDLHALHVSGRKYLTLAAAPTGS